MRNRAKATIEITAENKATRALNALSEGLGKVSKRFDKIGNKAKRTGRALVAGLTLPAGIFGVAAFNEFREFEQEMAKVAAVSGAAGDDLKALSKNAEDLGASTRFSASAVAGLQLEYSKLGFSSQEITKVTGATLALSQASGSDLAQSAAVAGSTLRAFGISANDTSRVTDVMALSFSTSALDLDKFQESMKLVAPVSRSASISLEETTGLLATLSDNGIAGSSAGTALRRVINELSKDGRPLNDVLTELGEKNLSLADAEKLVGKNAQSALLILAKNAKRAKELTKQYEGAEGAAQKMADTMDNTANGALARLSSSFSALKIRVGGLVAEAVLPLIEKLGPLLSRFGEMSPAMQKVAVVVAAVGAAVGPLVFILGTLLSSVGSIVAAFGGFTALIAGISFAPIIAGVAALAAGGFLLYQNWGIVVQFFRAAISSITSWFQEWVANNAGLIEGIKMKWGELVSSGKSLWDSLLSAISNFVSGSIAWINNLLEPIGGLKGAWEILKESVGSALSFIGEKIGLVFEAVSSVFNKIGEILNGNVSLWEGLGSAIGTVIGAVVKLAFDLGVKVGEALLAAWDAAKDFDWIQLGKDIIGGLVKGVKAAPGAVKDALVGAVSGAYQGAKDFLGIRSPSRLLAEVGRFTTAGLAMGIAQASPQAEMAAEMAAANTLAAFERSAMKNNSGAQNALNSSLSFSSDTFSAPSLGGGGFGGDFGGGFGGGGFGQEEASIPGQDEIEMLRSYHDQRIALLQEKGLEETEVAKGLELQKADALGQIRQQQIAGYSGAFDSIIQLTQAFGGKQSGALKGLFAISKGFAVAESVLAIQTAVAKATALGFPQNIPFIAQAVSQGASIISTIRGTQPSFEGGGFTGGGARTGGVDGKGGFNAVLHPNESVIDHTRNQNMMGGGVTLNLTINGDPNPAVVDQIREEASNLALQKLSDTNRRKGTRAKQLTSR